MVTNQTERGCQVPAWKKDKTWAGPKARKKKKPVMIKGNPFLGLRDYWGGSKGIRA
jgi:hypothetical protein